MKKIAVGDLGEFWYGDYKEPFEQLEGGVPGHPVGVVLKADDGKLLCAWCGKTYDNLGFHVATTHGTPAREYKNTVGLLQKSALVSDKMRATLSRRAQKHGFGTRKHDIVPFEGSRVSGLQHGMRTAEHLNKTGTCYAQTLAVGRTVLRETGRLSERSLRKHGIFANIVRRYFGDMDGFRKAIGIAPINWTRHSDAALLAALRNLASDLGHTPTRSDIRRYGLPSQHAYISHFGSWINAVRRAGLQPNLPTPDGTDLTIDVLVAYATLGSISRTARHLHMDRVRIEDIFARYGAPFPVNEGQGVDVSARKEWAAEMARRLAGEDIAA